MEEPVPKQSVSPNTRQDDNSPDSTSSTGPIEVGEPAGQWKFSVGNVDDNSHVPLKDSSDPDRSVSWSASEYIAHKKSISWYLLLVVFAIAAASIVFFLTHDKITTGVILFAAIVLGIFAARKPRVLDYKVDGSGVSIGRKSYDYSLFKSFSVIQEGAFSSILLMPMKRFMPSLSLYYDPKDEKRITDILLNSLPFDSRRQDFIDSFMNRIRF